MPERRIGEPPGLMKLLLRKTRVQPRIEGLDPRGWSEDDYAVVDGETSVGRIYKETIHGEPKWRWFLQTAPAPPPNSGMADTLEEAKAGFKRRYAQVRGLMTVTAPRSPRHLCPAAQAKMPPILCSYRIGWWGHFFAPEV
jgi:hypothetical protein